MIPHARHDQVGKGVQGRRIGVDGAKSTREAI
jgi:hypothetical protein